MRRLFPRLAGLGVLCLTVFPSLSRADAPSDRIDRDALELASKIDRIVRAEWAAKGVKPTGPATDAEFLRRLYLDVAGRIPLVSEVREFLEDASPDKRRRAVEKLLDGPHYVNHLTNVYRALLVPPTNNQQLQGLGQGMDQWLRKRFRENVGYNQLVRELITAPVNGNRGRPAAGPADPPPLAYYQFNEFRAENLAASTSRLFLGVNLECAQCHDHPFAKWTRKQFWEYAAFFSGVRPARPEQPFNPAAEDPKKREIDIPNTDKKAQARFLDGSEPTWKDEVSTRATLAEWLTAADNPYFARAAANRMWAHFFGIGIVEPVDEPTDDNPPSHPELLDEMAKAFAGRAFDLKFLVRAITLSKTYQLSSAAAEGHVDEPRLFNRMAVKGLTAEQLYDSLAQATGYVPRARPGQPNGRVGFDPARQEFLTRFANHADKRTEVQTSILQALALMNGRFVADATSEDVKRSGLFAAVLDLPFLDTAGRVETLYLATLSRPPRDDERDKLVKYVNGGGPSGDPKKALADVYWALLNSSEFILNH